MKSTTPQVGIWYKEIQQGLAFEVVAIDEKTRSIEVQLIDGAVTEYDFENWNEMLLEKIEEPEDWRNAYELSPEDYLDPDDTIHPEEWAPVNMIETDIINGILDDV